ncbi:MAG: shikimate kinase [Candidatus Methanomethylophilaceae archaeon]|nr:shikimate kinase [Candidatus Methanomethylophilaceae archaeon]
MRGRGESHGSITVINAMPCGIGATIGVDLTTSAVFREGGDSHTVRILNDPSENTSMAEICVRRAYEYAGLEEPRGWDLSTESQIPVSRGLKSSSTACNAILRAVFSHIGTDVDPVGLIRLGVGCAREAGVTVTGAFDDACGCGLGGFVMTDNSRDEILHRGDVDDLDVLIHVPRFKLRKRGLPLDALRATAPRMREVIDIAVDRPFEAMTMNGRIVSEVSGVDNSLAERALALGALGAGMSGSGPAVAVVVPRGEGRRFAEELEMDPEETIHTVTRCGE